MPEKKKTILGSMTQTAKENPIATLSVLGSLITLVSGIVGGWLFIDGRYAHADVFAQYKVSTQSVQQQTNNIQQMLLMQMQTRKTILEMKQAQGKLTPEEKVELDSLKDIIKQAQKNQNNH